MPILNQWHQNLLKGTSIDNFTVLCISKGLKSIETFKLFLELTSISTLNISATLITFSKDWKCSQNLITNCLSNIGKDISPFPPMKGLSLICPNWQNASTISQFPSNEYWAGIVRSPEIPTMKMWSLEPTSRGSWIFFSTKVCYHLVAFIPGHAGYLNTGT